MTNSSQTRRVRLTVATLVRNDAVGLEKTMLSVEAITDEFIVVDTGSSDRSRDVAAEHGARVFDFEWCDSFSNARNHALRHATGDWVLWLDAGETLSSGDAQALRAALESGLDSSHAYYLVVKYPAAPGVIAGEQVARLRLMPRLAQLRFSGRVRESVMPSLEAAGLRTEGLPWRIVRGEKENDVQTKVMRSRRNLHLARLEMHETGQSPRLLNCTAEALVELDQHHEAISVYQQAIRACFSAESDMLEAYYGLLTALDKQPESRSKQLSLCIEALEKFPLDAQLLCALGGYLQGEGRVDMAARSYQIACEYGRVDPLVWHLVEIDDISAVCWSLALQLTGQNDASRQVLTQSLERNPASERLRRSLLEWHVRNADATAATAQLAQLKLSAKSREHLRIAIQGACLAVQQNWQGARPALQSAFDAGCRDAICSRWLAATHLGLGDLARAEEIFEIWADSDPHNHEPRQYLAALATAKGEAATTPVCDRSARPASRNFRLDGGFSTAGDGLRTTKGHASVTSVES